MDTSETYIKMRLQATSELGIGNPIKEPLFRFDRLVSIDAKGDFYYDHFSNCQLERQDQLQGMINPFPHSFMDIVSWVIASEKQIKVGEPNPLFTTFTSMEQLWLAFVMEERWNKSWNGEDWVLSEVISHSIL